MYIGIKMSLFSSLVLQMYTLPASLFVVWSTLGPLLSPFPADLNQVYFRSRDARWYPQRSVSKSQEAGDGQRPSVIRTSSRARVPRSVGPPLTDTNSSYDGNREI